MLIEHQPWQFVSEQCPARALGAILEVGATPKARVGPQTAQAAYARQG